MTIFHLSEPTIFPDLNKKENKEEGFAREQLIINSLKYKHFRSIIKLPEEDQMHHLLMMITDLSEDDVGELTPADAAELSKKIFQAMKKYLELGQQIMGGFKDDKEQ